MKTHTLLAALTLAAVAAATPAFAQPAPLPPSPITPPRIIRTVEPLFPAALLPTYPKGGHARLALQIAADGTLDDVLVIGYTARGFADEALWVAKRWRYEPTRLRNEPISSQWELLINFEPSGNMVSMLAVDSTSELARFGFGDNTVYRPRLLHELDQPPVATKTVQPAYTAELQQQGVRGEVTIEFFIDERGDVRLPALHTEDQSVLGGLAAAALREWKFQPPTVRGRPVLVKARQTFRFTPSSGT